MVRFLIKSGHESVLEHEKLTVIWECDRGISHEIVRHRLASYSQESTRYVTYDNIEVIEPFGLSEKEKEIWKIGCLASENSYKELIKLGCKAQLARGVLPNSLKTRIAITANIREWRHILKLRTSRESHPQMQQMAIGTLNAFKNLYPALFEDIHYTGAIGEHVETIFE